METITMSERISNLKKIKKASGLSMEKVAREIGVSTQTIHRWFNLGDEPKSDAIIFFVDRFIGQNQKYLK